MYRLLLSHPLLLLHLLLDKLYKGHRGRQLLLLLLLECSCMQSSSWCCWCCMLLLASAMCSWLLWLLLLLHWDSWQRRHRVQRQVPHIGQANAVAWVDAAVQAGSA